MTRLGSIVANRTNCRNRRYFFSSKNVLKILMANSSQDEKAGREDLIWLQTRELSTYEKSNFNFKGLNSYLVAIGCATTVGVLVTGLYNMYKGDSRKQQMCMRYRVLAQGVTVVIAATAMISNGNIFGKIAKPGQL